MLAHCEFDSYPSTLSIVVQQAIRAKGQSTVVTTNGNIALGNVTDKEMELIWSAKAKHGTKLQFMPQAIQVNNRPEGTTYSNVTFTYTDLHSLNVVAEVVNEPS